LQNHGVANSAAQAVLRNRPLAATKTHPIKHAKAVLACGPSGTEKKTEGLAQVPGTT
jgi:hypothetical protein